jgi:hypothetical protein
MFQGARRRHTGGMVDEVPIIAKKGEGIFTAGQMAALAPVGAGGGGGEITVNVYPAAGQTAQVQQKPTAGGGMSIDVLIVQVEDALGERAAAGVGRLVSGMAGRFGLQTAVG